MKTIKPKFKVGDEIWVKSKIVYINENGTYCIEPCGNKNTSTFGASILEEKNMHNISSLKSLILKKEIRLLKLKQLAAKEGIENLETHPESL